MPNAVDKAIVNASPIIVLARIRRTDLLRQLYRQVIIPTAVAEEIRAGQVADPAQAWLDSDGNDLVNTVGEIDPVIAAWDLGAGESEVLTWARRNPEYEAIIDDRGARNCASTLRIPVRGKLGIVLLAKHEGRIHQVEPILRELIDAGLRLRTDIIDAALKLAGER